MLLIMGSQNAVIFLIWLICCANDVVDAKNLANAEPFVADTSKATIAERLTSRELHGIFGTDDPSKFPAYEIVHPLFVDHNARHDLRARRSLHDAIPMFLQFRAFDIDFHVNVTKNKDIVPENQYIEHHTDQGVQRLKGRPATLSTGTIVSDPNSNVALDHSSGLRGMIIRDDEIYIISPVSLNAKGHTSDASHGAHVIFKRSALPEPHPSNKLGCGVLDMPKRLLRPLSRKRRASTSKPEKTMELMIVADKNMLNFYGKDFLQSYLLAQANMVAGIYKDPTLEYPITVVLTRLVMLDTDEFANATDIYSLMEKFKSWTSSNNPFEDSDPLHVDIMALVTKDGCADGCLVKGISGVGMCGRYTSQSVIKDGGVMMSITMAHEIAHNLGLDHDGSSGYTDCADGIHIMARASVTPRHASEWSKCSSDRLTSYLQSGSSYCFDDKPGTNPFPANVSFQLYGTVYDDAKQCQLLYNVNYTSCRSLSQGKCNTLYCSRPGGALCDTSLYPPAHGTWCGAHKWCIHGSCVTDGTTPTPAINGGWSEYAEYTACNRLCGGGVQWRERKCNNPTPQHGGKNCVGSSKGHWKTCNMQACPAGTKLFRTEQCQALGSDKYFLMDHNQPCKLVCATSSSNAWYYGNVADGTFFDNVGPDICIQGVKRSVGCDLILESGAVLDRCGVCKGDGSSCKVVSKTNMQPFASDGHHEFGIVPLGSRNIVVEEMQPTHDFLGVKVGTSPYLAYYIPSWSTSVTAAGSTVKYTMNDYHFRDKIEVDGPLTDQIRLIYVNYYGDSSKGISWKYYEPAEGNTSAVEYAISTTSTCSKTCAGGTLTKSLICRRSDDKTRISLSLCSSLQNPTTVFSCNTQPCPAEWHIYAWTTCSRSCGTGQRTRSLNCSQLHSDGKYYPVNDSSVCTAAKPTATLTENCNTIMCNAEWVLGNWSACSSTCGPGTKTRTATCKRTMADGTVTSVKELDCYNLIKPASVEECNGDVACPAWATLYRPCTKTCGGGFMYSYNECRIPGSDIKVNNSLCTATPPPTLPPKPCATVACESYEWRSVAGTCSVSCGDGIISINVTCSRASDNATVADEMCLNSTKPETVKSCYVGQCPEVYEWKIVKGVCSVTCGNGTVNDTIGCFRQTNSTKVDDIYCDASVKPPVRPAVTCVMETCPETYSWNVTYGHCSVSCSDGIKVAVIKCVKDSDNLAVVGDSFCTLPKPQPPNIVCNMGDCPPKYFWKELWLSCNATCGTGVQSNYYRCYMSGTNTEMTNSHCNGLAKPSSATRQCKIADCFFHWLAINGDCLVTCGSGYKVQSIICKDANETTVDNAKCINENSAIPSQIPCSGLTACTPLGPAEYPYYGVGCFNDNNVVRRLPYLIGDFRSTIDWNDMSKTVGKCAKAVNDRNKASANSNFPFFSIQFYGECWSGDASVARTYFTSGSSTNCYMGTGGSGVNYVYHFGSNMQITNLPAILSLGCFTDSLKSPRPLPILIDNFRNEIDWNRSWSDNVNMVVKKCALAASRIGYNVFGIQHDGECWSGPNAISTYSRDGPSAGCNAGVGTINNFFAYKFA